MKRLIIPVVLGAVCLLAIAAEAQVPDLTFIQGPNQTRSIRGKYESTSPPSWNPIVEPNPQGTVRISSVTGPPVPTPISK